MNLNIQRQRRSRIQQFAPIEMQHHPPRAPETEYSPAQKKIYFTRPISTRWRRRNTAACLPRRRRPFASRRCIILHRKSDVAAAAAATLSYSAHATNAESERFAKRIPFLIQFAINSQSIGWDSFGAWVYIMERSRSSQLASCSSQLAAREWPMSDSQRDWR